MLQISEESEVREQTDYVQYMMQNFNPRTPEAEVGVSPA